MVLALSFPKALHHDVYDAMLLGNPALLITRVLLGENVSDFIESLSIQLVKDFPLLSKTGNLSCRNQHLWDLYGI